jgi:hypothetical protein
MRLLLAIALMIAGLLGAQPNAGPVVEIKGVIKQVNIGRGQGMPHLDVEQEGKVTKVQLGSMRYLIAENFNPKAGQQVIVKGYKSGDTVLAIEVTLPAEKKTLKLRDEQGRPLWRGGPRRFGRSHADAP